METETEAWRVSLNPKTWLSTKNVKGDGEAVKANDKKPEQIPPQPQNGKKRKVPVLPPANPNESRAESRDGAQPKEAKTKREQKITLCFLKKKKFPCCVKADPEPSLDSMCASCNNNCCRVCDILCKYVHDAIRCIYCIVNCTCPKTNFCLMLRQLVAATCAVCTDCIYIVRHILKCIVGISEQ
ncbi:unnamed protein product [Chrysodeixis includens]|uniref:Uncharacterized protein n=1 Tax=Chrysodeixis includens TaxID=689277 RepID=A0A9P0BYD1_CHRIL|nr:unnamed protein product [Chrysodeixis includens]